jgi:catechol 2,3-dioxygenase-like lactoylglutathione lyase family enzyme
VTRYVHTNLIARDWRRLAEFYENVFGCVRLEPERDLSGAAIDKGTGVAGAHITGAHLRLPGHGENGPTLEVFQYSPSHEVPGPPANRTGFGHLAFEVDDVEATRDLVLAQGGHALGAVTSHSIDSAQSLTWVYVRDPEGNILELQHWHKDSRRG